MKHWRTFFLWVASWFITCSFSFGDGFEIGSADLRVNPVGRYSLKTGSEDFVTLRSDGSTYVIGKEKGSQERARLTIRILSVTSFQSLEAWLRFFQQAGWRNIFLGGLPGMYHEDEKLTQDISRISYNLIRGPEMITIHLEGRAGREQYTPFDRLRADLIRYFDATESTTKFGN